MEKQKIKAIIEAVLFSAGKGVSLKELELILEEEEKEIREIIIEMNEEYASEYRGIEIISINDTYQMCSKKEYYEYIYPIIDNRTKPKLSQAALETLSIIAYNPRITRAEIEAIRGVSSDATIYKLLEYNLIEEAGKLDVAGRPITYRTTDIFLKLFGYENLEKLPELPKFKIDENQQIVIDDLIEENKE